MHVLLLDDFHSSSQHEQTTLFLTTNGRGTSNSAEISETNDKEQSFQIIYDAHLLEQTACLGWK